MPDFPQWTLPLIQDVEWRLFETLCQRVFQSRGYRSELTSTGADGGIDIFLYEDGNEQPATIVQCKAWAQPIDVKPIRELAGIRATRNIPRAVFMAQRGYTQPAETEAKEAGVTLFSGEMLLMMLKRLPADEQEVLYGLCSAPDATTPTCSRCEVKMKYRHGKDGRADFWGCPNYRSKGCKSKIFVRARQRS